jgi:hypothetical protein
LKMLLFLPDDFFQTTNFASSEYVTDTWNPFLKLSGRKFRFFPGMGTSQTSLTGWKNSGFLTDVVKQMKS